MGQVLAPDETPAPRLIATVHFVADPAATYAIMRVITVPLIPAGTLPLTWLRRAQPQNRRYLDWPSILSLEHDSRWQCLSLARKLTTRPNTTQL
jgi:hypothetical protein